MEEFDVATVARRSIHGIVALISRTFIIQIISQIVGLLLTIFLAPSDYGIFFIVSSVIVFLSYFSDVGLAAALIQKKENITEEELKTTFTIQQILVISVVLIALFSSEFVSSFYNLENEGIYLYQALVVAFFMSSLKTIPSVILERKLQFKKLVIPEIVETFSFNIVVLTLAIKGFGVSSFTFAVLARGILGLVAIYVIAPWRIQIGFSKDAAKRLLSYGIPFQANSLLALIKDNLLIVYLGKVLPFSQVGYIGVAQKLAFAPLRLVMDNIIRIMFPSFARLAHDKNHLKIAVEKSLFVVSILIFPSVTGIVILMPHLINIIPKYQKWEPALLSLTFFAINATLSSITTPLTNALNAIGKIKITLYLMVFWTVSTWVLTPLAILLYGFNGVAAVSAGIATSVILVVFLTKRYIELEVLKQIAKPFAASLVMGIVLYSITSSLAPNIFTLFIVIIFSGVVYFGLLFLLAKAEIKSDIQFIAKQFKKL